MGARSNRSAIQSAHNVRRAARLKLIKSPKSELEGEIDMVGSLVLFIEAFGLKATDPYRRIAANRWYLKLGTELERLQKIQKRRSASAKATAGRGARR